MTLTGRELASTFRVSLPVSRYARVMIELRESRDHPYNYG